MKQVDDKHALIARVQYHTIFPINKSMKQTHGSVYPINSLLNVSMKRLAGVASNGRQGNTHRARPEHGRGPRGIPRTRFIPSVDNSSDCKTRTHLADLVSPGFEGFCCPPEVSGRISRHLDHSVLQAMDDKATLIARAQSMAADLVVSTDPILNPTFEVRFRFEFHST